VRATCQIAHYSSQTKKKAGIVLILESGKDQKYLNRLIHNVEHFNLANDTWRVGKD